MQTAEKPKTLVNPYTGDELIIFSDSILTSSTEETLVMEAIYQQSKSFAPEHYHPLQQEHFEVLSGTLRTRINGTVRDYKAGEVFVIPAGTPHAMYNAYAEEVRFYWKITPALRSEAMFTRLYSLLYNNASRKKGRMGLKDTLYLLADYRQEFVLTTIPMFIQKLVFRFIAVFRKKRIS